MARVVRRVLGAVGGLVVAAIVAGAVYQWFSTRHDIAHRPPPGEFVDVGGHRLHISCSGGGDPTVVFERGLGGSSVDWGFVEPTVAGVTRPIVLVGASLGGFSARVFATVHEDRTAGLVLVDASHEDQNLEVPTIAPF